MGAHASSSVRVALDKPAFRGGEAVTGSANLFVAQETPISGVFLDVRGRVKTGWREERRQPPGPDGEPRPAKVVQHRGRAALVHQRLQILPAGTLQPGQLSVPFSFELPRGAVPTFQWGKGGRETGERAEVVYTVGCVVDATGWLAKDATHVAPLKVLPEVRAPQPVSLSNERSVTMFCCINKGRVSATVQSASDTVALGAPCELVCAVNNASTVALPRLRVTLTRHVTILDNHGGSESESTTVVNQVFEGFAPGEECTRTVSVALGVDAAGHQAPPVMSALIRCRYVLGVTVAVPWGGDLNLSTPVQLVFGPEQIFAPVEAAPEGWAPAVQPAVEMELPMAQALPAAEEGDAGAAVASATVVPQ